MKSVSYIQNLAPYARCSSLSKRKQAQPDGTVYVYPKTHARSDIGMVPYVQPDHDAEGWLCSDGKRVQPMCREHADEVMKEYHLKLGDASWHFEELWPTDEQFPDQKMEILRREPGTGEFELVEISVPNFGSIHERVEVVKRKKTKGEMK